MPKRYLKISVSSPRVKGPSKSNYFAKREPMDVSADQLNDLNGFITNGVFRLRPNDDNNRLLLQVNWYLANKNEVKARSILRTLGLTAKKTKTILMKRSHFKQEDLKIVVLWNFIISQCLKTLL